MNGQYTIVYANMTDAKHDSNGLKRNKITTEAIFYYSNNYAVLFF